MIEEEWWLASIPAEINQGDIFADIPFLETAVPPELLKRTSMRGGEPGWMHGKNTPTMNIKSHWLTSGQLLHGMLLNHECDLDKPTNRRCIFVSVLPLANYQADQQELIITQRSIPLLFLPEVPSLGNMVADFRITTNVPRAIINGAQRKASPTELARMRILSQFIKFYTRSDYEDVVA